MGKFPFIPSLTVRYTWMQITKIIIVMYKVAIRTIYVFSRVTTTMGELQWVRRIYVYIMTLVMYS